MNSAFNTSNRSDREEQRLTGDWWRPETPNVRVSGILHRSADSHDRLELMGSLLSSEPTLEQCVVIGDVYESPRRVTICRANFAGESYREDRTRQTLDCQNVLLGAHFEAGEQTLIHGITLETTLLANWLSEGRPEFAFGKGVREMTLTLTLPESLEGELPGVGSVTLNWLASRKRADEAATIAAKPSLTVEFAQPMTVQDCYSRVVVPFILFTSFCTGLGDSIAKLVVWGRGTEEQPWEAPSAEWRDVAFGHSPDGPESSTYMRRFQLVQFTKDVRPVFGRVVAAWFEVYGVARSSLMDLHRGLFNPAEYGEESFARTVRSLETWHRALIGGAYMAETEFLELLESVIQTAGMTKHKEFLKMRLKYANERTLKQRLDELVQLAGEPVSGLVKSYDHFTRRVTDTRNTMTHDGSEGEAFSYVQLIHAKITMELVMRAVLLRQLGYPDKQVGDFIVRTQDWRIVAGTNVLMKQPST